MTYVAATRDKRGRRASWIGLGVVIVLALGVAVSRRAPLPITAFLLAWSVLLGGLAFLLATSKLFRPLAWVLAGVIGYHALFGPAMLLHCLTHESTRNDDLALRLWPHVVHWINSFE